MGYKTLQIYFLKNNNCDTYSIFLLSLPRIFIYKLKFLHQNNNIMRNIKKYGSMLLLSVVILAACAKKQIKPKTDDLDKIEKNNTNGFILISTAEDLQNIRNNLSGNYLQMENIELANLNFEFEPIGTEISQPFTGTYNGNGKYIADLNINKPDQNNVGLFGYSISAKIEGINLINANVIGKDTVGALVGNALRSTIANVQVGGTSTVTGSNMSIGGLIGFANFSNINIGRSTANVFATDAVNRGGSVGGLIGRSLTTNINNSYATGNVSVKNNPVGMNYIGGLVGYFSGAEIKYSYAKGNVIGGNVYLPNASDGVGGLVGGNTSSFVNIYNSYATGKVEGNSEVGGLVGSMMNSNSPISIISQSYATGNVIGRGERVGGLIGNIRSTKIEYSYATGSVTSFSIGYAYGTAGGLVGFLNSGSTINQCYAIGNVNGVSNGISASKKSNLFVADIWSSSNKIENSFVGDYIKGGVIEVQTLTHNNSLQTTFQLPGGVTKLVVGELSEQRFKNAGWNFEGATWARPALGYWPKLVNTPEY